MDSGHAWYIHRIEIKMLIFRFGVGNIMAIKQNEFSKMNEIEKNKLKEWNELAKNDNKFAFGRIISSWSKRLYLT